MRYTKKWRSDAIIRRLRSPRPCEVCFLAAHLTLVLCPTVFSGAIWMSEVVGQKAHLTQLTPSCAKIRPFRRISDNGEKTPEFSPIPSKIRQSGEKMPEISPTPAAPRQSSEKMPEISPSPAAPRHFGETFRRILLIPAAFYGDSAPFYYPKRNRRAHLVEEDARCVRFRPFLLTPGHNYCQVCTPKHSEAAHRVVCRSVGSRTVMADPNRAS